MRTRAVSWSEINAWKTCRMRWWFGYAVRIEPRVERPCIALGDVAHRTILGTLRDKNPESVAEQWLLEKRELGLFDEELEDAKQKADLAIALADRFSKTYRPLMKARAVEQRFEIPIRGLKIKLRGIWDAIVEYEDLLWLLELKIPSESLRPEEDVELGSQIGIYEWAARRLKIDIAGTLYLQVLGKLPATPRQLTNGNMSREIIRTDWETYRAALEAAGLDPDDYLDMQEKLKRFEFDRLTKVYRSPQETKHFIRDIERCVWDLVKANKHIYMCDNAIHCRGCSYRDLCLEIVRGRDWKQFADVAYRSKQSEEEVDELWKEALTPG